MNNNQYGATTARMETSSFLLFLITLCFAPLAFGTSESWSILVMEILVSCSGLLFICSRTKNAQGIFKTPALLPVLLLIFFLLLQCLPLPSSLVRVIAPNIYQIYTPVFELHGSPFWIPLTVHFEATVREVLRLIFSLGFYVLTVQLLTKSSRLRITVYTVLVLSGGLAFEALVQKFISPQMIYGFKHIPASAWQGALGPWVNPNQYAGFMVMVSPLFLALFFYLLPALKKNASSKTYILTALTSRGANLRLLLVFFLALILSSIFLSHSRGGVLSVCLAVFLFYVFSVPHKSLTKQRFPFLLIISLIGIALLCNWNSILRKFSSTISLHNGIGIQDGRLQVWQDSLRIIYDFPLTGAGFGTFHDLFPAYKSFSDIYSYMHAHNDYLELLTDGGIIAFCLGGWFIVSMYSTVWKQLKHRQDPYAFLLTIGALSGISGMLFYSLTDFNLHNGANGLYFFFLCGLAVSAAHTRHHSHTKPTLLGPQNYLPQKNSFLCIACFVLLTAASLVMGGGLLAERNYKLGEKMSVQMMRPEKKRARMIFLLEKAQHQAPFSAKYDYALANLISDIPDKTRAFQLSVSAMRKQPTEKAFYQSAVSLLSEIDPVRARQFPKTGPHKNTNGE